MERALQISCMCCAEQARHPASGGLNAQELTATCAKAGNVHHVRRPDHDQPLVGLPRAIGYAGEGLRTCV